MQSQKLGHRWLDLEALTQLCQKANIQLDGTPLDYMDLQTLFRKAFAGTGEIMVVGFRFQRVMHESYTSDMSRIKKPRFRICQESEAPASALPAIV